MDDERLRQEDEKKINYVRDFLIHDFSIAGRSDLIINRTAYPKEKRHDACNYEDMVGRGTRIVRRHGFEPIAIEVPGSGNESLYRAVSHGLMNKGKQEKPDDYLTIYETGIDNMGKDPEKDGCGFTMNPRNVLNAVATAYSVRIIVFNAMGQREVALDFSPPPDTVLVDTVYVLCIPTIDSITQAYALESLTPVSRDDQQPEPSSSSKEDRIFRQNTMPKAPTKAVKDAIERLKTSTPFFSDMRCLWNEEPQGC